MPTVLPPGLVLSAFMEREDPRDVFISRKAKSIAELPRGATVGTASLRRQAMVKRQRPDLDDRAAARQCRDAAAQARRGRGRRDLAGARGIEAARPGRRRDRSARRRMNFCRRSGRAPSASRRAPTMRATRELLAAINHADTVQRARRRARLSRRARRLVPHADRRPRDDLGGRLRFRGMIVKPDGSEAFEATREGDVRDAEKLGADAGARIEGPRRPRLFQRVTMRLLVTRPEPDNERTAAALRAKGHEVVLAPLLHIEAVAGCRSRRAAAGPRSLSPAPTARARCAGHPRRAELLALPVLDGRPQQRRRRAGRGLRRRDVGRRRCRRSGAARGRSVLPARGSRCFISPARIAPANLAVPGLTVRTVVVYRAAKAEQFPPAVRDGAGAGRHRRRAAFLPAQRRKLSRLRPRHRRAGAQAHALLPVGAGGRAAAARRRRRTFAWRAQPDEASLLALVTPKSLSRIV